MLQESEHNDRAFERCSLLTANFSFLLFCNGLFSVKLKSKVLSVLKMVLEFYRLQLLELKSGSEIYE